MYKLIPKFIFITILIISIMSCGDDEDNYYPEPRDASISSMEISSPKSLIAQEISQSEFNESVKNITERKVSKNAQIDLVVKSLNITITYIHDSVKNHEGYIVNSTSYTPNTDYDNKWARISVRVPSDSLDNFLNNLINHADETIRQSIYTQDITEQYIDVKAKIESLESSEQRLVKLLDRTNSVSEIVEVEKELSRLRSEIDSLKSRFNLIQNSVVTSLIEIYLEEIPNPISINDPSWNTRDIALDAIKALSSFGQLLIRIIVFLFVFTPVWILIAGVIYGASRIRKRSK